MKTDYDTAISVTQSEESSEDTFSEQPSFLEDSDGNVELNIYAPSPNESEIDLNKYD